VGEREQYTLAVLLLFSQVVEEADEPIYQTAGQEG